MDGSMRGRLLWRLLWRCLRLLIYLSFYLLLGRGVDYRGCRVGGMRGGHVRRIVASALLVVGQVIPVLTRLHPNGCNDIDSFNNVLGDGFRHHISLFHRHG